MKRVFAEDLLRCGRCGGEMRLVAVIENPAVTEKIRDYPTCPVRPTPERAAKSWILTIPYAISRRETCGTDHVGQPRNFLKPEARPWEASPAHEAIGAIPERR